MGFAGRAVLIIPVGSCYRFLLGHSWAEGEKYSTDSEDIWTVLKYVSELYGANLNEKGVMRG